MSFTGVPSGQSEESFITASAAFLAPEPIGITGKTISSQNSSRPYSEPFHEIEISETDVPLTAADFKAFA